MIFNKNPHFVSDATIDKKLTKVSKIFLRDARKKVNAGELDAQGLALYLPKLEGKFSQVQSEVNTAVDTRVEILKTQFSKDYANVEKLIETFDNELRRLNAAHNKAEQEMKNANIPQDERESVPVTYENFLVRFKKLNQEWGQNGN